jgi:outer membrane protein assembly factor BamB
LVVVVLLIIISILPIVSSIKISSQSNFEKSNMSPGSSWWNMFHRDTINSGFSESNAPETNTLLWTYQTENVVTSSPAVAHGKVFIGSWDRKIYCLDMMNGDKIWSFSTNGEITSSPAVVNEKVYIGSQDSYLYCLDANDGSLIWTFDTNFLVESSPTYKDGRIYFGSSDGTLYCLNSEDGSLFWNYPTQNVIWSAPAVTDDKVYFGSLNGVFYCLDIDDGDLIWDYTANSGIWSSPTVFEGKVYFGSNDNFVYCLNANTGSFIWSYDALGEVHSSPAVAYGNVYIGASYEGLYCLDKDNGDFVWKFPEDNGIWSAPSIADDKVYFGSDDCCGFPSLVYCLNAYDGNTIWSYDTGSQLGIKSSPAIVGGNIFIGSGDGIVFAFGEGDQLIADCQGPYLNFINQSIQFRGSAYGGIPDYSYNWDFGDGETSTEQNPTHIYTTEGKFDIILTVTDSNYDTTTDGTYALIKTPPVNNPPDKPTIEGETNGNAGEEYTYCITVTDPDKDNLYVIWDWGDNETTGWLGPFSSGEKICASHSWSEEGNYEITVYVKDEHGKYVTASLTITMPKPKTLFNLQFQELINRILNSITGTKIIFSIFL